MDAGQGRPTSNEKEHYRDENVETGGAASSAQQGESRMMVTTSTLAGENPAIVHEPGTDVDALDLEEELEGVDIMDGSGQPEILVMSVKHLQPLWLDFELFNFPYYCIYEDKII
ncbi:Hypothetical predicted protein [Paramuricea clavata]|uniref:Uncharacterized protein n=1 Tax=Paramuricea clavata TaxID=317549 RepID=A0A7D9I3H5_PARCT|nr:Hypothetical predicted protein [Paramuricea clavata]